MVLLPRPGRNPIGLGSSPFARHYLGNHYCFLLLTLLRCFSSGRLPPGKPGSRGLSHSEIHGSTLFCSSPWLIAALHVLHRLCMPRHPPCALSNFAYMRRGYLRSPSHVAHSFTNFRCTIISRYCQLMQRSVLCVLILF